MLNAIIIEDEKAAHQLLVMIMNDYCPSVIYKGHASTLDDSIKLIEQISPDVIFLDIELKDCDAFDILKVIDYSKYKIIFTTAYEEYALKAFQYEAIDYILKPYSPKSVIAALDKVRAREFDKRLLEKLTDILPDENRVRKVGIPTTKGIRVLDQNNITHLEACGSYCRVYIHEEDCILSNKCLKELESKLCEETFFRVHLSHLVNVNHIKNYLKEEGGTVLLSDERTVPVSRRRKAALIELLSAEKT